MVFSGGGYQGTAEELLNTKLAQLKDQFSSFDELNATSITTRQGVEVLSAQYSGINQGGQVEGRLYAAVAHGTGFLAWVLAPPGQARAVQSDVNQMIKSVVIP